MQPSKKLFVAVSTIKLLSILGLLMMPFQISVLIDRLDLSAADAGLIATMETTLLGIGVALVSLNLIALKLRTLVLLGLSLALLGNFLSVFTEQFGLLLLIRAITGLGYGLANATASKLIATAFDNTERAAGQIYALVYLITTVLYFLVPHIIEWGGALGFYGHLVVLILLFIPMILFLPSDHIGNDAGVQSQFSAKTLIQPLVLTFLVAEAILMVGVGAVWSFSERFAEVIHLSPAKVGLYFSLSSGSQFLGALLASWVAIRFGRTKPILACLLPWTLICYFLANAYSEWLFAFGILSYQFLLAFMTPYLLGTGASLDKSGNVAAAIIGVQIFSFGAGSAFGGFISDGYSLAAIGVFAVLGILVAIIAFPIVTLKLDRQTAKTESDEGLNKKAMA